MSRPDPENQFMSYKTSTQQAADSVLEATLKRMQAAEEIQGIDEPEYIELMEQIAREALLRSLTARARICGLEAPLRYLTADPTLDNIFAVREALILFGT